jgi:regulatory protein
MEHRITALKAQKKNPDRISVYLDGEFAFGSARIVAAWLHVGQMLDDEKIAELQRQENQEAGLQKAMLLLSYRPRSEAEIRERLTRDGYAEDVIGLAVERLREGGLLRDDQFAREWVENRGAFRPRSRRMLSFELRRKGLSEETIQQALVETDDDALAYQAAAAYAHKLARADREEFRRKMAGFLARRGFSYNIASPAIQRVWQELHPSGEMLDHTENEESGI